MTAAQLESEQAFIGALQRNGIIIDKNVDRTGTLLGSLIASVGAWNLTFLITSGVCLLGAACWLLVDPVTPLDLGDPERLSSEAAA